ncbi:thiosulfate/3-mercaptopyruvate sulfurtransferase [Anoxybacillus vitaminiphilus]|uniref:Thiosulfate/3-mercaptopyruvate sulfurtransferase n=1 Tax=Paranoxybacillus vitaminiphilus TaxID=581036 RepID=A0A327YE64_9BACL|nr:sulfurtransferase [Anoxybacillus vitaminiphilus]RAK18472.1 thiosulfate/3-mercaptopyruvate sulfurtransferase [Anoxybacillus vitaminiphilus]
MKYVVTNEWLANRLNDEQVRIIDCRYYMGDASRGLKEYIRGHIPGALYFDLEIDLSAPAGEHGGRHPLPNMDEFIEKLSTAGIDKQTIVVAYDSQASSMASRFWWMLRYLGHEQVYVLDGGYENWVEESYPVTTDVPLFPRKTFVANIQPQIVATVEDVREAMKNKTALLIDSREPKRYLGIEEPIDRVAGHIPSAKNYFWREGLTEDGHWKKSIEQEQRFADIPKDQAVIVYCGSGVTACPNVLALTEAGYTNVRLYVGSWSDWISYPENPIAAGKNE